MAEFLATLQNLFTFAFVVSSMLAGRIGDRHASRHDTIDGGACGRDMNARG